MKTLYVLRHAKSDWAAGAADHERPLNRRGRRAAETVGRWLAAIGQVPDAVVSSSAVRARTTAERAARAGGWDRAIEIRRELYESSPGRVLAVVREQDDRHASLLVAGHEPTSSALVGGLIGDGAVRMVTAAVARVDLAVERWADVEEGCGVLVWLVTPKILQRGGLIE